MSGSSELNAEPSPDEAQELASQACRQCSRLKRKCQRELPACFLCTRLGKECEYPSGRRPYGSGRSLIPASTSAETSASTPAPTASSGGTVVSTPFPDAFFLDRELFGSVSYNALGGVFPIPSYVSQLLEPDWDVIYESYFNSVDTWFPFVSKKRLKQCIQAALPAEASGVSLILLCMRLVVDVPQPGSSSLAPISALYKASKTYLRSGEDELPTSLHILQSMILVALYEVGHGIFPAAYLTIGRAARLGLLRGLHDWKNATQLFRTPPTWTYWEEERRTWWAILILERYINIGPSGLPLAAPEPAHGELLPTSDAEWSRGGIGTNTPVYVATFSPTIEIGQFARACQASQILGRVIQHRNGVNDGTDQAFRLKEALQLHTTLLALDKHLSQQPVDPPQGEAGGASAFSAVDAAMCTSARYLLYHMYACNPIDISGERLGEETVLQGACIEGMKQTIAIRLPAIARHVLRQGVECPERLNPLVIQCIYDAASECQWLLREGEVVEGVADTLELLVEALNALSQRWGVAEKYIELLKRSEEQEVGGGS